MAPRRIPWQASKHDNVEHMDETIPVSLDKQKEDDRHGCQKTHVQSSRRRIQSNGRECTVVDPSSNEREGQGVR